MTDHATPPWAMPFRARLKTALQRVLLGPLLRVSDAEARDVIDTTFYRDVHPDVAEAGSDPVLHFRRFGAQEGRLPNGWLSERYVRRFMDQDSLASETTVAAYLRSGLRQKPRLIFVSHDASRTGAPAIILRLLEMFSESGAFECFSILDQGGERLAEFEALSHTHVMSHHRYDAGFSEAQAFEELSGLFAPDGVFAGNAPVCALVNSAESSRIMRFLGQAGVPQIALLHEIATYYPPDVFEAFGDLCEQVIVPSDFVRAAAERFSGIAPAKLTVRGQGLLTDAFGTLDRDRCRQMLRAALNVEDDAFIILNIGTIDMRKGADLFVSKV